ncbi:MAG: hypothetical protein Q8P30_04745 [Candidatus Uhrbacteria bacterium]|nr:hypothetical protein [Candidatus Uhrbacteria bacterium]
MKIKYLIGAFLGLAFIVPALVLASSEDSGGYVDAFIRSEDKMQYEVRGWAYSPEYPEHEVEVDIFIDGVRFDIITPQSVRSDVIAFTGVDNVNGFVHILPTNAFICEHECAPTHSLEIYSRDVETGDRFMLAGGDITVDRDEVGFMGYLDRISVENAQDPQIFVRGWAANAESPQFNYDIYIFSDGNLVGSGNSNMTRNDVSSLYRLGEDQVGFVIPIEIEPEFDGDRGASVQVYAYDRNNYRFWMIGSDYYYFEN